MIAFLLLQAALPAAPTITLAEANAMSPLALAARLLPERAHRPVVDAIINGRGMTPPSKSVNRVWIIEQMLPFDASICRSHIYKIEMRPSDPAANPWVEAVPTRPVKIEEHDRLWVPPPKAATVAACAAAPAGASGFSDGGLGLRQAAALVQEARAAFKAQRLKVNCVGEGGACGNSPRETLAAIDWSLLGFVEPIRPKGEPQSVGGDPKPVGPAWGPAHVQFTFPHAAGAATWVITVDRRPHIKAVRMEARSIIYH